MRTKLLFALLLLTCACASSNDAQGPRTRMRGGPADDMLPPPSWWHDPQIEERVNLSAEQMQQLDAVEREQGEEIAKLQRDLMVVTRDFRDAVDKRDAAAADITAAGDRLAALRDQLFRRRVAMLAAERTILTQAQWTALQEQLEEERPMRRSGGRGRRPGGFGGRRPPRNW